MTAREAASRPDIPEPTAPGHAATKGYVDGKAVALTGDQTIAGVKSFANTIFTRTLNVLNNPGDTARVVLYNEDAVQGFEYGVNTGGTFSIWDTVHAKGPFKILPDAPDGAIEIRPDNIAVGADIDMQGNYLYNVANPIDPQDVTRKDYVDAKIDNDSDFVNWSSQPNATTAAPTKSAVLTTLLAFMTATDTNITNAIDGRILDDNAGPAWDGDTTSAPSRNAVYDALSTQGSAFQGLVDAKQPRFMTGTVATASGTAAKTVTLNSPWSAVVPAAGDFFLLTFTNGNSASNPTVAINGSTARLIRSPQNAGDAYTTTVGTNATALYYFDGTNLRQFGQHYTYTTASLADLQDSGQTVARVVTGQRMQELLAAEATTARTLGSKTLDSPAFTGTPTGLTKAHVGLGSVDNTADSAKPISTAQQAALDLKAPLASPTFTGTVSGITKAMVGLGNVDNTADSAKPVSTAQQAALDLKAPLASPTFTGTVSGITKAMVGLGNVDNVSAANLRDRSTHTGSQLANTISDFSTAADARISAATIAVTQLGAGRVTGSNNSGAATLTLWVGTEAQYTAIVTKDSNTLYFRTA